MYVDGTYLKQTLQHCQMANKKIISEYNLQVHTKPRAKYTMRQRSVHSARRKRSNRPQRRRPHPMQYIHKVVHGRETEYHSKLYSRARLCDSGNMYHSDSPSFPVDEVEVEVARSNVPVKARPRVFLAGHQGNVHQRAPIRWLAA